MRGDRVLMLAMAAFVIWTLLGFPGRALVVPEPAMGVVTSSQKDHSGHGDHGDAGHNHSGHNHGSLEVSEKDQIPTVTLTVLKDPMSGWNAKVVVDHFRFAPENASQDHVSGEGHGHLYIDGVKINRLYGEWRHLGKLTAGSRAVMVSLSSNDHRDLTHNGQVISDTVRIQVD